MTTDEAEEMCKKGVSFPQCLFRKSTAIALAGAIASSSLFAKPVFAQRLGLIRDAETESLIRDYAKPIFQVAGLSAQNIRIHLVGSKSFNAFVVDGQNMFFHVGALLRAKTPNEIIGVLAHETGHISGGHLARLRNQVKQAQSASLMMQLLGLAAMAAGALAGSDTNIGGAGAAVAYGGQEAAMRTVLAYRRNQESQADQAAVKYLNATHQSAAGMLETFQFFADQGLASLKYVDPYIQSHPMPQQRIAQLRELARSSPYFNKKDPPQLQFRHNLMRAKLSGFLDNPQTVFRKYPKSDQTVPALYARTIATYRDGGIRAALPLLDALIATNPKYPYFQELKGQFLFEKGLVRESLPYLRAAVNSAPDEPLIRILLAQAMLAANDQRLVDEALTHLRKAVVKEASSPDGFRLLADAYGKKGDTKRAQLASAQRYLYEGKFGLAKQQAERAKGQFKRGSPEWIKADDILRFKPPS